MTGDARVDDRAVRVLFVCTANIARSAYAERRARQVPGAGALAVASAGVPGYPGRDMDAEMAAQLRARGGNAEGHVSRALSAELLADSDLVVTFEFAHWLRIAQAWPQYLPKVFGLHQLADAVGRLEAPQGGVQLLDEAYAVRAADGMHWDVSDPHHRGTAAARACADEIDAALTVIVPALVGRRRG